MEIFKYFKKEYLIAFVLFVILFPLILYFIINYIKKLFFINKCNKLLENGEYEKVKKLFIKKNPSLLSKEILKIVSKSYLDSGEKQKAIHYLQLMVDLNLLKDDYELLNNNLTLASLLFELNQTTESFNKLLNVKEKGKYNPFWNLLIGKIYLSQNFFEKALKYFDKALILDEKYFLAKFYYAITRYILNPEDGIKQILIVKGFFKDPILELFEGVYYFSKKNYLKASILFQNFLRKTNNDLFKKSRFVKEEIKINSKFYELYLTVLDLIFLILSRFYLSKPYTGEISLLRINLDKLLNYEDNNFLKYLLIEYSIYTFYIVKQYNFLQNYKKIFKLQFNGNIKEDLLQFDSKKFYKKIIKGTIFLDITLLSLKKPLYVKPNVLKEDFKNYITYKEKSESFKNFIRKFNTIDKKTFIKVCTQISKLLGYNIKRHKYIYSRAYESDGVNLKVFKTEPYYHIDFIVIRRFKEYRIGKNYLYFLDDMRKKENAKTLILISNMEFDEDFYNYKEEFENIKLIPAHKLGFLLESIFLNK